LRVGFVTIGQSPRVDVMNDLEPLLPKNIEIIERGALDGYTRKDIEAFFKPEEGETPYVTRLRDGSEVKVSKGKIIKQVEVRLRELAEQKIDLIVMLCSGDFPEYDLDVPIIYPSKILKSIVSAISIKGTLGILTPANEQLPYMRERWSNIASKLEIKAISPYTANSEAFIEAGRELSSKNVKFVVMDCIGYTLKQKELLKRSLGPSSVIINTRSIVARVLSELVS